MLTAAVMDGGHEIKRWFSNVSSIKYLAGNEAVSMARISIVNPVPAPLLQDGPARWGANHRAPQP